MWSENGWAKTCVCCVCGRINKKIYIYAGRLKEQGEEQVSNSWMDERMNFFTEATWNYIGLPLSRRDSQRTELWHRPIGPLSALTLDACWGHQRSAPNKKPQMDGDKLLTQAIHRQTLWKRHSVFWCESGFCVVSMQSMYYLAPDCQTWSPPEGFSYFSTLVCFLSLYFPWLDGSQWFTTTLILHLHHSAAVALSPAPRVSCI